jgi:Amt family ammonium transporter
LNQYSIRELCGGVLAGLVSVTAACAKINLWSASAIGFIGAIIYKQTGAIIQRFEIDDPLDISEIHGFCGIWSILAVGLFDLEFGLLFTGKLDQLTI